MSKRILLLMLIVGSFFSAQADEKSAYKRVVKLMGVRFEITAVSDNEQLARNSIDSAIAEITRIEKLISSWAPNSQTSNINNNAGIKPVKVNDELYELIKRSKKISDLTSGVFDISFASIDKVWKFDGSQVTLPSEGSIKSSVAKINYQNIILNAENKTIFLKEKGMKIGFGAIGKGYAANRAKIIMQKSGIKDGLVNASGDLITWGKMENGGDWSIGIANPKEKKSVMAWLIIDDMAVVTSGNYEKFIEIDNKKYAHIINPTTGWPATGTKSVTIICSDAEIADALATSVFILGEEKGINLINRLKNIECLIVTEKGELKTSKGIVLNYYNKDTAHQSTLNLK